MNKIGVGIIVLIGAVIDFSVADFECLCNYNVESNVFETPVLNTTTIIGRLYEFDCKPVYKTDTGGGVNNGFAAIQFENKIGYVNTNDQIQEQVCPGAASPDDLFTTRRSPTTDTTTTTTTTSTPPTTSTTTTPKPTTTYTSTTRRQPTTTTRATTTAKNTTSTTPLPPTTTTASSTKTTTSTAPTTTTTHSPLPTGMNTTGTPLQYIGVGYNLLHGNPDGNQYGSSNMDPGLILDKRILQLTESKPNHAVEAQYEVNTTACVPETHSSIVFDQLSYQTQLLDLATPSDKHPQELTDKAFTLSIEYNHLYGITVTDTPLYHDVITTCTDGYVRYNTPLYRDVITTCTDGYVRYNTPGDHTAHFTVTEQFARAVCQLPQTYHILSYLKFIETWGTSIAVSSQLGQRSIKRYHIDKLQAFEHVQRTAPQLVRHTGSYMEYASSLTIDTDNYTTTQSTVPDVFGTLQSTTDMGTTDHPVPIHTQLVPITYALDPNLWKKLSENNILGDFCSQDFNLTMITSNTMKALKVYAGAMATPDVNVASPLRIPVTWPMGTYGLMRASTGCPAGHVMWLEGWRKQDTEDHDAGNHYTTGITNYMAGSFVPNNLITHFCIKSQMSTSVYDRSWPSGQYCLLQYNNCPTGFERGSLLWDDEDTHNGNAFGGTMPTGSFDSNTKLYYCCRTDGNASTPITLPTDNPFILLRYGTQCQSVYNMELKVLFVRWDDQDHGNFDGRWGAHPYDDGGPHDHRLYFCHYHSNKGDNLVPSLVG